MKVLTALVLLCLFTQCTNPPITGSDVLGARDFVIDSYKIREGKYSILEMEGKEITALDPKYLEPGEDFVKEGDVLEVSLYHPTEPNLANYVKEISKHVGYEVENGIISLPDIDPISVDHITLEQLRQEIRKSYEKQIPNVEVFVAYKKRANEIVELIGNVLATQVAITPATQLFEVLSKAGVSPQANYYKSYLVRDSETLPVDFSQLVHKGDMSQNVVLHGGDKIYIADPTSSQVLVMGEVTRQGALPVLGNSVPLQEVLARAGGLLFTGNKAYIQVIRGSLIKPKIYTLNWRHIIRLPTESLLLIPGDIVYVAATPITEWNRFINQLLPSVTLYELFAKGIKGVIIQDAVTN